jgi:drug/metabolite transporter (DMT)-like permease
MRLTDILLLLVAVVWGGAGHILLRLGMRQVGAAGEGVASSVAHAATSGSVLAGTAVQAVYYVLYLLILSRTPVSIALPATALMYPVTAVLAWGVLGETPTPGQWVGTALVIAGVGLIARP